VKFVIIVLLGDHEIIFPYLPAVNSLYYYRSNIVLAILKHVSRDGIPCPHL